MKRLLTLAAMFLCCMATSFAQFSGSGSGTESDPYLILNPIQLNQMRNFLNKSNVYFKLMADIDLTEFIEDEYGTQGWLPIGTSTTPFRGVFDGNGKTISGLHISKSSTDNVGLFAYVYGTTIKNLNLTNFEIIGNKNVGALAGKQEGTNNYTGIKVCGSVCGQSFVGGLVGIDIIRSNNTFSNIVAEVNVKAPNFSVGGLVGDAVDSKFTKCRVINSIISGKDYVGGIGGQYGSYENCCFIGSITGGSNVGGISGYYVGVNKSFVIGDINATGDNVGGIVGKYNASEAYVSNCFFSGTISGNKCVGGIVGYKGSSGLGIVQNYASADIIGNECVGGICGYYMNSNSGENIRQCVYLGKYISARDSMVGRIVGYVKENIKIGEPGTNRENKAFNGTVINEAGIAKDVYNDNLDLTEMCSATLSFMRRNNITNAQEIDAKINGTGVSNNTLKLKATYVAMGWDFTDTWEIQETECYPYMKYQTAPPVIQSQLVSGVTTISGKCVSGATVTLDIDGVKQEKVFNGTTFSFTVDPLQVGHEVRVSAKAEGKEQSYFTTEVVSFLGKGTEADPYQVYTAADLTQVYWKGYFKLMNDIDLTSYINQFSPTEGWVSIGRDGSETIYFDGNGHKVTGLWCNSTRNNTGLFSCFANGTIKNLTVKTAKNKQVKGGANTGILIGKMINGAIENCSVEGVVADGTPVGGMVGLFDGGSISNCQANVTINTTLEKSYVGGLVGEITGGTIDKCFTEGSLTGAGSESYVGGLIGKNQGTLTNSYSTTVINSSYNAAGVVAYNYGVVDKCYAIGDLFSSNYAAGVIGYNDGENAVVKNCAAMNNKIEVTYESQQQQQGGGYGQRIIGGIKNNAPAPDLNNYALKTMQVSVNDIPQRVYDDIMNGTAKTAAELTTKATYQELGWDFTNIWNISDGTGYPYLTGATPVSPDDPNPGDDPEPVTEPDTDISSMNNVVYLNKVEANADSQINLSIRMKNNVGIRGFQFDLYLPEGITAVKNAKGKIINSLSEGRLPEDDEHSLSLNEQSDGSIRFLCGSLYDETFTGNDGEIATISIKLAEDMEDGDYPIILRNMKLTETDINNFYQTDYVKSTLTVKSYMLGDINDDGKIDVSDYIGIANHILGNTPDGFVLKAADVNEDGLIDVSDYIGVANIILSGSIYGSQQ